MEARKMAAKRRRRRKYKVFNIFILFAAFTALAAGLVVGAQKLTGLIGIKDKPASESQSVSEGQSVPVSAEPTAALPQSKDEPASKSADIPVISARAEEFLGAIRRGDREEISGYADYDKLFALAEGQRPDWILQQILMRMRYEIKEIKEISPNEATVEALFTNIDMVKLYPEYYQECMLLEYQNGLAGSPLDAAELERRSNEIFVGLASENAEARVEIPCEFTMTKADGKWSANPGAELGNAMLGGYIDAQRQMSQGQPAPAQTQSQEPAQSPQAPASEEAAPEENTPAEDRPEWASPDDVIDENGMVVPRE
jgi:hypothetical protein